MSSPADLGGTGITEQAVARDILFIGPDESGVDTCAHVQFWRGPSLVPQTLSYQFCIQVSLRTTELSIGPTGVQDLQTIPRCHKVAAQEGRYNWCLKVQ